MFTSEHLLLLPKLELGDKRAPFRGCSPYYKETVETDSKTVDDGSDNPKRSGGGMAFSHDNGGYLLHIPVDKHHKYSIILV
tara:strand:+ start:432 stop:674 length:243 start_codon:yes stop_codon:yes gene_type:complete